MFINPKQAIEQGWIKGIKDPAKQVQPNAIDFTVDKVLTLDRWYTARVSEDHKEMRPLYELNVRSSDNWSNPEAPFWYLEQGRVYDGMSEIYVEVPEGVAAILYTRSTFARNGVLIASGLYDSGFKGQIGFTIYPLGGDIEIVPGTRIGQIAFVHAENAVVYAGGYNHNQGSHYAAERAAVAHTPPPPPPPPPGRVVREGVVPPLPSSLVEPVVGGTAQGEVAQDLEKTHKWNSQQGGKPAGTQSFE